MVFRLRRVSRSILSCVCAYMYTVLEFSPVRVGQYGAGQRHEVGQKYEAVIYYCRIVTVEHQYRRQV